MMNYTNLHVDFDSTSKYGRLIMLVYVLCRCVEIIVSKVAGSPEEVATYAECTLLAASLAAGHERPSDKLSVVRACVEYLQENEFIAQTTVSDSGKSRLVCVNFYPGGYSSHL